MRRIDEARLETDLYYRWTYLAEFIGFGPEDEAAIRAAAAWISPQIDPIVEAVYHKLMQQDATWRHFLPQQHGYTGPVPQSLQEVTMDHPQIVYRKQRLAQYLRTLVTQPSGRELAEYLDHVGKMHTHQAGNRAIQIPLVQMHALLGFIADALIGEILQAGLDRATEQRTLRAFNKLLWLQNDLLHRHYEQAETGSTGRSAGEEGSTCVSESSGQGSPTTVTN
jgi:hypothetical protein